MSIRVKIILVVSVLLLGALVVYYTVPSGPDDGDGDLVLESGGELQFDGPGGSVETSPAVEMGVQRPEPARNGFLSQAVNAEPVLARPEPAAPEVTDPATASPPRTRLAANEPARVTPPPARAAAPPRYSDYVVRSGDTMSSIATAWFGDERRWTLIARANPRIDPDNIHVGDVLRLPPKNATTAAPPPRPTRGIKTTYIVQRGDTLSGIAKIVYGDGTKWNMIFEANRTLLGGDPNRLAIGMRLTLPDPAADRPGR